ncbi:MAG: hypothetical protein LBC17_01105, partial [Lactobacillaceae bacterium]|nr:hypothetical protein [Lactobacillaceae bacterium]
MNKYIRFILLPVLILVLNINIYNDSNINVQAKGIYVKNTAPYLNPPEGYTTYSGFMGIDHYGLLIYDADDASFAKYKNILNDSVSRWNTALGHKVLVSYQEINANKSDADVRLYVDKLGAGVGGQTSLDGYAGVGYELDQYKIEISDSTMEKSLSGIGTSGYAYAVSTLNHEFGHVLGM